MRGFGRDSHQLVLGRNHDKVDASALGVDLGVNLDLDLSPRRVRQQREKTMPKEINKETHAEYVGEASLRVISRMTDRTVGSARLRTMSPTQDPSGLAGALVGIDPQA